LKPAQQMRALGCEREVISAEEAEDYEQDLAARQSSEGQSIKTITELQRAFEVFMTTPPLPNVSVHTEMNLDMLPAAFGRRGSACSPAPSAVRTELVQARQRCVTKLRPPLNAVRSRCHIVHLLLTCFPSNPRQVNAARLHFDSRSTDAPWPAP
jgi:hypothetical protein